MLRKQVLAGTMRHAQFHASHKLFSWHAARDNQHQQVHGAQNLRGVLWLGMCCPTVLLQQCMQVFLDSSIPVVNHYEKLGKLRRIRADRDQADIYADVRKLFAR